MVFLTAVNRFRRAVSRVARTHYPPFIFGITRLDYGIPIFVFHDVDREGFARDLEFLRQNGYRTLTTEEFVSLSQAGRRKPVVLLTFDDARRNFWDVAFPILREFDARATLFVPTAWMAEPRSDGGVCIPNAEDRRGFMSWEQLRNCQRSGLVDVQLHGCRHPLVYTGARCIGFASPRLLARHDLYDWPMRREGGHDVLGRPLPGTPVYEAEPLLSADRRLLENEAVAEECRRLVASEGGAEFFLRPDWQRVLAQVHRRLQGIYGGMRHVADREFQALVRSEFVLAREAFAVELGTQPRYFAYPWMLGSDRSLQAAVETGMRALFGVGFDFGRARRVSRALLAFGRVKGDWLRFMPGAGRLRLREVVPRKVRLFFSSQHLAH
jgi:peptidoglycan/xylan/chitin deacetylase (PgdA/CDA1 family)